MPRRPQAPPPLLPLEPAPPACVHQVDPWGEDEEAVVRCDVVLGELRAPNDAMAQMIRDKLGRLLQDEVDPLC